MSEKALQEKLVEVTAAMTYAYLTRLIQSDLAIVEHMRAKIDASHQAAQSDPNASPANIAAMQEMLALIDFAIQYKTQSERKNP